MAQWEKLADCPLHTENYGDDGYIYQDVRLFDWIGRLWMAVTISDDGDEMDTPCRTAAEARQIVEGGN